MVKCWQCNGDLTFRPISKSEIILKCSDENCGFESLPINVDPLFKPIEITPVPEAIALKSMDEEKTVDEEISTDTIKISVDKVADKKYDHIFDRETSVPQIILTRKGDLNKFSIFCLDFSNLMDKEVPLDEANHNKWRERIRGDEVLPENIKEKLIELTEPPISFFRAALFAFSLLILENIKKMTVEDFHSFQIISMAGESEEVLRFPNFQKQTTPQIIIDFINNMMIRRQEYRSNEILEYRDYSLAIETISELLIEVKESYPEEDIQIYLITIGTHKPLEQKPINPIREIKDKINEYFPFSFNIIYLDESASDSSIRIFQQICRRFGGIFSKEITLKGLMNAIIYQKYEKDRILIKKKVDKRVEEVKPESSIESEAIDKSKIEEEFERLKDGNIEGWEKDILTFKI